MPAADEKLAEDIVATLAGELVWRLIATGYMADFPPRITRGGCTGVWESSCRTYRIANMWEPPSTAPIYVAFIKGARPGGWWWDMILPQSHFDTWDAATAACQAHADLMKK